MSSPQPRIARNRRFPFRSSTKRADLRVHPSRPGLRGSLATSLIVRLGATLPLAAEGNVYLLRVVAPGFPAPTEIHLDTLGGSPVNGWSFGVCTSVATTSHAPITLGSAFDGLTPDFHQIVDVGSGWTASAVLSFTGSVTLPPALDHWLYTVEYFDPFEFAVGIDFCNTLGSPPVPVQIAGTTGTVAPVTEGALVFFGFSDPAQTFALPFTELPYDEATGLGALDLYPAIYPSLIADEFTSGFQMAGTVDPQYVAIDEIVPHGEVAALNGGSGPDEFLVSITDTEWTVSATYDLTYQTFLTFDQIQEPIRLTVSTQPTQFSTGECAVTPLGWTPFQNSIEYPGGSVLSATEHGWLTIHPVSEVFQRGDCNGDTLVDIADAIDLLNGLFVTGVVPLCAAACDHNDDEGIDIADAAVLLGHLFAGGDAIPQPRGGCGPDPTPGTLDCLTPVCP